jgi:hypothetical protein
MTPSKRKKTFESLQRRSQDGQDGRAGNGVNRAIEDWTPTISAPTYRVEGDPARFKVQIVYAEFTATVESGEKTFVSVIATCPDDSRASVSI